MKLDWHIKTTMRIAIDLGLGPCAAACLAAGDAAVDLLHFDDPIPHGMTPADDDTGEPTVSPDDAEQQWEDWITSHIQDCFDALDDGDCCAALYALGMALHSIQDVEAHQGMTNAEHAKRWVCGKDPDGDPDNDPAAQARGEEATREFIQAFLDALSADDLEVLEECDCDISVGLDMIEQFNALDYSKQLLDFWWLGEKWCHRKDKPPKIRW